MNEVESLNEIRMLFNLFFILLFEQYHLKLKTGSTNKFT